jgi:hypothetical protein
MAATDSAVIFEGRRWPAARVVLFKGLGSYSDNRTLFTATGKGQRWSADRPLAFWRNFSEYNPPNEKLLLWFLNRHGDPTGQLDRRAATGERIAGDTSSWGLLIQRLRLVAAAWDEADELGISSLSDDKHRLVIADRALRLQLPADPDGDRAISQEVEVLYTNRGLTLRPRTLRAFMTVSAASARERGINMRRCMNCLAWFELRRIDAFYCSASCQAVSHKRGNVAATQGPRPSKRSA